MLDYIKGKLFGTFVGFKLQAKRRHKTSKEEMLRQRESDYELLLNYDLDWSEYKEKYHNKSTAEAVDHYLDNWQTVKPLFRGFFDTVFYVSRHPDIKNVIPLVHFLRFGQKEGRKAILSALTEQERLHDTKQSQLYRRLRGIDIDWSTLCLEDESPIKTEDPCAYYCCYWREKDFVLPGFFDQRLYLDLYPDLVTAIDATDINPLEHFYNFGRAEGRCAYFKFDSFSEKGDVKYDKKKKTIVIVSHESSATGAPLVGFSLGQHFADDPHNYNVIHWILRPAEIHSAFLETSCLVIIGEVLRLPRSVTELIISALQENYSVDTLIGNSVETMLIMEAASDMGIATVALIHEFSEYTRPYGKIARSAMAADRVIIPAEIIKQSLIKDLLKVYGKEIDPGNIIVMPQGKIPQLPSNVGEDLSADDLRKKLRLDSDTKLIIGAGYVQVRKGVDLFVSLAEKIRNKYQGKCKFVWVGGGYCPEADLQYSTWLETHIEHAGLSGNFIFLDHQKSLDNILQLADIFVLPSRLDPFPNVIIDALAADVHVSCFENATGCADFMIKHGADASIAKYLDVDDMADKIIARLDSPHVDSSVNSRIVEKHLSLTEYTQNIIEIIEEAKSSAAERKSVEKKILSSKAFDAAFYGFSLSIEHSVRHYVRAASKNLNLGNPRPGFSDLRWLSTNKIDGFNNMKGLRVPLGEAIEAKKLTTHDCIYIPSAYLQNGGSNSNDHGEIENISSKAIQLTLRYAVHIHLHYPELAEEFAAYVSRLPGSFDVILTLNDDGMVDAVQDIFANCGAAQVIIATYDNIGRDVAPFIKVMAGIYDHYEVIGHFHSKKSLEAGGDVGDRWRQFLLNTLIGPKLQVFEILQNFEKDPRLGLLMAEDRHVIGFTKNKPFADAICDAVGIEALQSADFYPLGTMFWARTKAIKALMDLDIDKFLDPEPLPYDGSYMHAIERLIPHFVETSGYKVKTIHVPGVSW